MGPRTVLDDSCVTKINHESHFSWQGQSLVMLENESCDVAGDFVIWLRSTDRSCVAKMGLVSPPKRWVRDDDFMLGLSSDHAGFILGLSSNGLSIGGSNSLIFGSNLELKISWQAQYLVMLEGPVHV